MFISSVVTAMFIEWQQRVYYLFFNFFTIKVNEVLINILMIFSILYFLLTHLREHNSLNI